MIKAMNSGIVKRTLLGACVTGAALMGGSAVAAPAMASTGCTSNCPVVLWPGGPGMPGSGPTVSHFGQVAAAPVKVHRPINQVVGTVGAPLVNVNIPCPAPWWQGGVLGAKYNACSTAKVNQQDTYTGPDWYAGHDGSRATDFGQVAAAPVQVDAPINQVVGTVGAPLVNVNIPCPAPWNQGGVLGAKYNACNTAPVNQQS